MACFLLRLQTSAFCVDGISIIVGALLGIAPCESVWRAQSHQWQQCMSVGYNHSCSWCLMSFVELKDLHYPGTQDMPSAVTPLCPLIKVQPPPPLPAPSCSDCVHRVGYWHS
jgi:hypothetical protein